MKTLQGCLRVVLGLFVLWQAFFMVSHNLGWYLYDASTSNTPYWTWTRAESLFSKPAQAEHEKWAEYPNLMRSDELAEERKQKPSYHPDNLIYQSWYVHRWWARKTAQEQGWSLFAPSVYRYVNFVAVELVWKDENNKVLRTVMLRSENEPKDPTCFFRVGKFRLRRLEGMLEQQLLTHDDPKEIYLNGNAEREGWVKTIYDFVWDNRTLIGKYLQWRTSSYLKNHPQDTLPTEARLLSRNWRIADASEKKTHVLIPESEEYLARWKPDSSRVDYYDPNIKAFFTYTE